MHPQDQPQVVVTVPPPPAPRAITVVGADGKNQTLSIPATEGDMRALMARRQELSDQLTSVSDRRHDLSMELIGADAGSRAGLQQRLAVLDNRIVQLENDVAVTGSQLAAAPSDLIGIAETARDEPQGDEFPEGVVVGGGSVLFASVMFFFFARRLRKRRSRVTPQPLENESSLRLQRLEQGMDAIAVEIERISEGQRFVTKLLSEPQPLAAPRRVAPAQRLGEER
jgi:hypothetical protein